MIHEADHFINIKDLTEAEILEISDLLRQKTEEKAKPA
jgi:hypothetical protein